MAIAYTRTSDILGELIILEHVDPVTRVRTKMICVAYKATQAPEPSGGNTLDVTVMGPSKESKTYPLSELRLIRSLTDRNNLRTPIDECTDECTDE